MKKPDIVLRELDQLFDFYRELAKFRIKPQRRPEDAAAPERKTEPAAFAPAVSGGSRRLT